MQFVCPKDKDFVNRRDYLYAGFNFPVSDHSILFKRMTPDIFSDGKVVLTMPDVGKIKIRMPMPKNNACKKPGWMWIQDERYLRYKRWNDSYTFQKRKEFINNAFKIDDGIVEFPFVGLGLTFVGVLIVDGNWGVSQIEIAGL